MRPFRPIRPLAGRSWPRQACLGALAGLAASCSAPTPAPRAALPPPTAPAILPDLLDDPLEPVNRGVWAFNRALLQGVIHPLGRAYETVVPEPARTSIRHFRRNTLFPGRAVNQLLQARWSDAGDESLRFLCNTTAGVAGLFDVATRWNLPRHEADFGQTFQHWGWRPGTYLMLPLFGPSDECNGLGTVADEAAEPWNYSATLRRLSYGTTFNHLSATAAERVRMIRSTADPYAVSHLAWSYLSRHDPPDWSVKGPRDPSTLQTLAVASIRLKDPAFLDRGRELSAEIPATGKRLGFNCWLQPGKAPLVFVSPGLGSHRLSTSALSVAEALHQQGFSVAVVSSIFHPEFMEHASTAAMPGHPPTDNRDLLEALTAIDRSLEQRFPGRFGKRAFVGCSMAGYQALHLAAHERTAAPGLLRFDRYVAINPPFDLHHAIACIDRFHNAPLAWPASERQARVNNAAHKVGGLTAVRPEDLKAPPFDAIESKYLIGLTFRMTLRDALFSARSRHPDAIPGGPVPHWRREAAYGEILDLSYDDYLRRIALPYYASKGVAAADFKRHASLANAGIGLRSNPKTRVIANQNDFLLRPGDIEWLQSNLGHTHVRIFPEGGHLGNLASPQVQQALTSFLADLR